MGSARAHSGEAVVFADQQALLRPGTAYGPIVPRSAFRLEICVGLRPLY